MESDATDPAVIELPSQSTTTSVTTTDAGFLAENSHVWPLLILAVVLVGAIVALVLYGHEPDTRLYDLLLLAGGAIAGITQKR